MTTTEYVGAWTGATSTLDPAQLLMQAVDGDLELTGDQVADVVAAYTTAVSDRLPAGFTLHANGMLTGPADWAGTPAGELLEQAVTEVDLWDILRTQLGD